MINSILFLGNHILDTRLRNSTADENSRRLGYFFIGANVEIDIIAIVIVTQQLRYPLNVNIAVTRGDSKEQHGIVSRIKFANAGERVSYAPP